MEVKEALKLNLGSRDRSIPGFKNMDIDPHSGVDFVGDVSDLSRFEDCSVAEIFASNILEHFPHTKTLAVLKEWHRVLEGGGTLYLSVPDFHRAVEIYLQRGIEPWVQNFLMGDQVYPTAFHYSIFNEPRLKELLETVGFSDIEVHDLFDFAEQKDCSNLLSSHDGRPVCLNVAAIK